VRVRIGLLAVFATALAGCGAVAVIAERLGDSLDDLQFFGAERRHLDPVPVPDDACPALGLVRTTAAQAGEGWLEQLGADNQHWRQFAEELGPKLQLFDAALVAAIATSPPPVALRLEEVLNQVRVGQQQLAASTDLMQYLAATEFAVLDGEAALADASDLVGGACGERIYSDAGPSLVG
jgi:hypothetical protein